MNTIWNRNDWFFFICGLYFFFPSVIDFIFIVIVLYLTGANFVISRWKKGLYKEGSNEVTNTDKEVESIDEGSAFLRSKSEY